MKKAFLLALGVLASMVFAPTAHAACTDSYTKTTNSITVNWDVSSCEKLHQKGDFFEICWKENTINGLVCQQHRQQFNTTSGAYTLSGLKSSKGYTLKTSYQRKVRWDKINDHNITTDTAGNSGTSSPYLNHSELDAKGCRTIKWGGVAVRASNHQRLLAVGVAMFGKAGTPNRDEKLDEDVSGITPNGANEYSKLWCGPKHSKSNKYKLYIVDKEVGATAAETILTNAVIFSN
jgi:hypothetical protein